MRYAKIVHVLATKHTAILQGNPQEKKQLPDDMSYYSSAFPATAAQHVGRWGPPTEAVLKIERTNCHHKAKTDLANYYC